MFSLRAFSFGFFLPTEDQQETPSEENQRSAPAEIDDSVEDVDWEKWAGYLQSAISVKYGIKVDLEEIKPWITVYAQKKSDADNARILKAFADLERNAVSMSNWISHFAALTCSPDVVTARQVAGWIKEAREKVRGMSH